MRAGPSPVQDEVPTRERSGRAGLRWTQTQGSVSYSGCEGRRAPHSGECEFPPGRIALSPLA